MIEYQPDRFYIPVLKRALFKKNFENGVTASYYPLSANTGIKIFNFPTNFFDCGRDSIKSLYKSTEWKMAKAEYASGKKINRRFKNSAKVHKLTYVKSLVDGKYYPAILMEHIKGKCLCDLKFDYPVYIGNQKTLAGTALKDIIKALRRKGLIHGDLHDGNILSVVRGDRTHIKLIDFQAVKEASIK